MPLAQVRTASDCWTMPALELEEELRRGRLSSRVLVQHPDWTGAGFVPADDVPALREALASDEARTCARLRAPRRVPWATALASAAVGLTGALQAAAPGGAWPTAALAVGFERTVQDGAWWTPLTGALAHAGPAHLAVNLPLLAYCGYRVERALGAAGAAAVLLAALACSTLAIVAFSDLPVVGASTLAYGVWGAQIAIGLRHGTLLPAEQRGRYGAGNLALFLPLAFASLFAGPGVSLVGHAGGLAGGVIAAALTHPLRPRRALPLVAAALTAAVPFTPPGWWAGPTAPIAVSDGASITLPARWRAHAGHWEGMLAWSSGDRYPLYAGTFSGDEGVQGTLAEREAALWSGWLGAPATARATGPDTVEIQAPAEPEPWVLVERVVEHDGMRTRAGYVLPGACADAPCEGRRAVGDPVLASLRVDP